MTEKGTLTILADNRVVLGLPMDMDISAERVKEIENRILLWINSDFAKPLLFGFPVDVVDLRQPKPQINSKEELAESLEQALRSRGFYD